MGGDSGDTGDTLDTVERFALADGDTILLQITPDGVDSTRRRVLHRFHGLEWQCLFEARENGAFLLVKIYLPVVLWTRSLDAIRDYCFRLPRVVFSGSFAADATLNTIYYQSALHLSDEPLTRERYSYFLGRAVRTASLYLGDFDALTTSPAAPVASEPTIGTPHASGRCHVRRPRRHYRPRVQRRCESWRDWLREPQQPWPGDGLDGPFS